MHNVPVSPTLPDLRDVVCSHAIQFGDVGIDRSEVILRGFVLPRLQLGIRVPELHPVSNSVRSVVGTRIVRPEWGELGALGVGVASRDRPLHSRSAFQRFLFLRKITIGGGKRGEAVGSGVKSRERRR